MSKRLEKELEKIKYANISRDSANEYSVQKEIGIRIEENKYYLIEVDERLRNPDNIIATNWNSGKFPKCSYYQIEVIKKLNNMIKVVGAGCNDKSFSKIEDNFNGWLSTDLIEVLQVV